MSSQRLQFEYWQQQLAVRVRDPQARRLLLEHATNLISRGVPPIIDFQDLASATGIDGTQLGGMLVSPSSFYREFDIPKRKGGTRRISAPYESLAAVQRWIKDRILNAGTPSDSAHAYLPGRSVITNATVHLGKRALLRIDIEDFFPSISYARVYRVFRGFGYLPSISRYLASVCCLRGGLPQGAATSPALCNLVCASLDRRLRGAAEAAGLVYSRYADDLVFSGERIDLGFITFVGEILGSEGFRINAQKTLLVSGTGKKVVTGVSVGSGMLKLPKATRRRLRQEFHYLSRFGLTGHLEHLAKKDFLYLERIIGQFGFWRQVEPANEFVNGALSSLKQLQKSWR